ncbi:hypothetical protein BMS3Abin03_00692 [bacterium BMS3Abin03]|nr:hypothetical protein BMS3Abin03_00692 [bacterium BMS3Abin03]
MLTAILIALSITFFIPVSNGYSQSYLRINSKPDGNGSGSSQLDNSDNTVLYIIGGAVIAGIIVYAVIKKNKEKKEPVDTSATINGLNSSSFAAEFDNIEYELAKTKDKIPVNVFLGIKNNKAFVSDKTYMMGVSIRF